MYRDFCSKSKSKLALDKHMKPDKNHSTHLYLMNSWIEWQNNRYFSKCFDCTEIRVFVFIISFQLIYTYASICNFIRTFWFQISLIFPSSSFFEIAKCDNISFHLIFFFKILYLSLPTTTLSFYTFFFLSFAVI